jgi:hypothetical protein
MGEALDMLYIKFCPSMIDGRDGGETPADRSRTAFSFFPNLVFIHHVAVYKPHMGPELSCIFITKL